MVGSPPGTPGASETPVTPGRTGGPGTAAEPGAVDAPSWAVVLRTELTRLRRGFPLWYSILMPAFLILPLGLITAFSPEAQAGRAWDTWIQVVLMFWGVLLPMSAALYAGVAERQDDDARRLLYTYAFPRSRLLIGKFLALAVLSLASAFLLIAFFLLLGAGLGQTGDLGKIAVGTLVPWAAFLGALALCLIITNAWGFTATMCTGVAGMMFGALLADKVVWWVIPLAWPMRMVVPIAGIEASGVPLPDHHPLNDLTVLPIGVGMSLALAVALLAVGARYVNRKEL